MDGKLNERFFENADGLARNDANSSSSVDRSRIRIDNLERRLAVTIAHELTKRLDALGATGRSYNDINFSLNDTITESDRNHFHDNQTVFESLPALGNYRVEVKLPERSEMEEIGAKLGAYSVLATVTRAKEIIRDKERKQEVKEILQESYISLFNRVDFFPSDEQMDIEKQLLHLGVPVNSDTREEREIFEGQEAQDLYRVNRVLRNIGVKDIEMGALNELCETKRWDPITVIDLYIEVMTEKQKKKHEFPIIRLTDLTDHTNYPLTYDTKQLDKETSMAQEIRYRHEGLMAKRFASIGLEEEEVLRRYEIYDGDENSQLAFRFGSWLVSRDFMSEESDKIARRIRMGEKLPNPKLYKELTASVYRVYAKFNAERHENYNLGIEWQKADYQSGHEYFRNMILLCLNIFHGKDISKFRDY